MTASIWVAELIISDKTEEKIVSRHRISAEEVKDAIVCIAGLPFRWDDDPDRGKRALVRVKVRNVAYLVVLYPVQDPMGDVWALGSAYPLN
ncbi:hypothetical protein ACIQVC_02730 [Streptomyces sp. NPDC101112]|uniref:hypothetical protein n=1 Tax=Streptomyces sp. NPDC101112 TaxID=3366105 RepID=UPI003821D502